MQQRSLSRRFIISTCTVLAVAAAFTAMAQQGNGPRVNYQVEVINLTRGQTFTPLLVTAHDPDIQLFDYGQAALPQVATLAETGNVAPLADLLNGSGLASSVVTGSGLTMYGKRVAFEISANPTRDRLSLAAMLIPTNDAFVAVRGARFPTPGKVAAYYAYAYDAGSERNDEACVSIPGPNFDECGGPGAGGAPGGGEGFVHVHNGMHNSGDFDAARRDWRGPVALVIVSATR